MDSPARTFCLGDLEIDEARGEVRRAGVPLAVHATPLRLLFYLLRHRGRLIPKRELLDRVWAGAVVSDAALATALKELRRALADDGHEQRCIETLRGRGYRWVAPVQERGGLPVASDFVGRDDVLDALGRAADTALAGSGRCVLLTGEAGIGKTRCAEELARLAEIRGVPTQRAWCQEGDRTPAYWPWAQVLRSVFEDGGADPGRIAPLLGSSDGSPRTRDLEAGEARLRLFDALAHELRRAAADRGLVLLLDDLQWADTSSLAMLAYLGHELPRTRILVVGTLRDSEVNLEHPIAETLAELARADTCERIELRGLAREDVRTLVARLSGTEPDASILDELMARTDGNPFLVRELASVAGEKVGQVPSAVADVTRARLRRLSRSCGEALAWAATLGGEFTCERLAAVSGTPDPLVAEALDEAQRADVVREVAGRPAYRFSHALVRDAVEAELPAHARALLHRRVGEALEALHGGGPGDGLAELARHFDAADDAAKAVDYATRAGHRAMEIPAFEAAGAHFEHALAALERLPSPEPRKRCDLLRARARAYGGEGRRELYRPLCREAAELAERLGDTEGLVDAALGFAAWSQIGEVNEEGARILQRALQSVGPSDSPDRVQLLSSLGLLLGPIEGARRADALLDEAEACARRIGDARGLAAVATHRSFELWRRGVPPEALLAATDRALALAEADLPAAVRDLHQSRVHAHLARGDLAAAEAAVGILDDAARWSGVYLATVERYRARRSIDRGRLAEAEARIDALEVRRPAAPSSHGESVAIGQRYLLRREQGRVGELAPALDWLRTQETVVATDALRAFEVLALADLGRGPEARAALARLEPDRVSGLDKDLALFLLADACATLSDVGAAPCLYEHLLPLESRGADLLDPAITLGSTARLLGNLALVLGRLDDAERHFEDALVFDAHMEAPLWEAYDRVDLARALHARGAPGDRDRACALADEALAWARERDLPRLSARVESVLGELRGAVPPREAARASARAR